MTLNVLSLFSGIGGLRQLELGLERAGMTVVGQVELDPFCRKVLAKHWPEVPRHDDVRTCVEWWLHGSVANAESGSETDQSEGANSEAVVGSVTGTGRGTSGGNPAARVPLMEGTPAYGSQDAAARPRVSRPVVDVICGGFPCQDISNAGRRAGIGGERSGLWSYMAHAVSVLRPRYVVMENVAAILVRGLDVVAGDLAACGYDLQWDCIPAAAVGAPHQRDRWWGVAYPSGDRLNAAGFLTNGHARNSGVGSEPTSLAYAQGGGFQRGSDSNPLNVSTSDGGNGEPGRSSSGVTAAVPNSTSRRRDERRHGGGAPSAANGQRIFQQARGSGGPRNNGFWSAKSDVCRVADGVPNRVDRLRSLGNAVVPQVSEHVGRLIMEVAA